MGGFEELEGNLIKMVLSFPPEVFGRLEPELYLQRHVENGIRPSGNRQFEEFRALKVQVGNIKNTIGSSLVRAGGSTVVCGITAGVTETMGGGGVYPNVEIIRGSTRSGPPTEEEMILSQQCYDVLTEVFKDKRELFAVPGLAEKELVLNATVQVLSRTGPCFDLVWAAVTLALKNTVLPSLSVDVDTKSVSYDTEQPGTALKDKYNFDQHSASFGVVEVPSQETAVLLADVDGETEEGCVKSRLNVVSSGDGTLRRVSLTVADSTASAGRKGISITKKEIQSALRLARQRSVNLSNQF